MEKDINSVKVWDVFIRIFHWTLVGSMLGMYLSGENFKGAHVYLGYFIICLILARVWWGFLGPKHVRFSDFLYRPGTIWNYLKSLIKGNPKHYLGHNPAGGLMIIIMLAALLLTTFTGLKNLGSKGKGPLANNVVSIVPPAYADGNELNENDNHPTYRPKNQSNEFWEEIHESMTSFMIFLVIVHVAGVIVSSWVHKENLILGMITGRKPIE